MNLHEQMRADLNDIFLNVGEFAELHDVEGRSVPCIVDDGENTVDTATADGLQNASGMGLLSCQRVLCCKAGDIDRVPLAGERIRVDGILWLVGDGVSIEEGLLTLPLNRAY